MDMAISMARSKNWREAMAMANAPAPFNEVGSRAIGITIVVRCSPSQFQALLERDYNCGQMFSFSIPSFTGKGLIIVNGIMKGQNVAGDISTLYKTEKTIVDVTVDLRSNISSSLIYDASPETRAAISFSLRDHKFPKLDVMYHHRHAAMHSSVGLNARPRLEVSAAIGSKDVSIGGEIAFDTSSSSFTKCSGGIIFNNPGSSAAIILTDKGQTLRALYTHLVNPVTGTEVVATMTHGLSSSYKNFCIGSVHKVDSYTLMKTRFSSNGNASVLCQRDWSPKSFVTLSAKFDIKAITTPPIFGLNIALKP